ncbi:MAG TPA: carboxypeptidase regulatory-like domain-containing protein [Fimbriiglobus sp.]|nr:carboxypeptidase regulatory-like domain-containing protein [Fimbriiglobus sp.]
MTFIPRAAALVGAAVLLAAGCGSTDKPIDVSGKVTFKGEPVAEGSVQFVEDRTGRGAEVDLRPDGTYKASLFAGEYKVVVTPPYLVDESKGGLPNPYYKKVKNIPAKYHSTDTSGLTANVSADKTVHDFDLKP